MILARRSFLAGLGSMLATPAIVHAGNLMPVRSIERFTPENVTIYVNPISGAGSNDGLAPLRAFRSFADAMKAAEQYKNVTVQLASGVYLPETMVSFRVMPEQSITLRGAANELRMHNKDQRIKSVTYPGFR